MEKKDFEKMRTSKGELISFNYFLSTSKKRCIASVADVRALKAQKEKVLFSMNTVFRIGQLIDRIREETFPGEEGWFRLGPVLGKTGESAKA